MACTEMPKKIKLVYFDARARAELTRLTLAHAGVSFEDVRLEFVQPPTAEWVALKPNTPWESLPILEVDGKVIGQSMTIARFVAKLTGIYGDDIYEQAKYDAIVDACQDVIEAWGYWLFEADEKNKEKLRKDIEQKFPPLIKQLEKILDKDDFFGGSKLSWADLQFYHLTEVYKISGLQQYVEASETLSALFTRIQGIPQIKKYLDARKFTEY